MLEIWKPLLLLKNKNNPVLFNEIGFKYDNPNKNLRPPLYSMMIVKNVIIT